MKSGTIRIPSPDLQVEFARRLREIRSLYLQDALGDTVSRLSIPAIDTELASLVPKWALSALAKNGLRGELMFSVPSILETNPRLLAYYRLLLGFSQKAFYGAVHGTSPFKSMEDKGLLTEANGRSLPGLCRALNGASCELLKGVEPKQVSHLLLDDLTLLTLGAQLRGGANVRKGARGTRRVFELIHRIVGASVVSSSDRRLELANAAGRKVLIEFSPDPDIIIREEMSSERYRNIIAIEVKGGTDFSNIHNRIGEAEKSHQKARSAGYVECWTVVNVDRIDVRMAHRESPSTNRFYRLGFLEQEASEEFGDFKERIVSLTGIV